VRDHAHRSVERAANQTGTETQHWQDAWQVDGLGNYLDHQRVDQTVRRWNQVYDSSGTLLYLGAQSLGGGSAFKDTTRYDYIGQGSVFHIDTYAGFNLLTFRFQHTKLTNAYRADNLLMAAETTIDSTSTTTSNGPLLYTEHEEYRYDALGRRIWVRSLHGATCQTWYPNGDCASALKREVWDGSSLIYESRYPGDVNLPSGTLEQETGAAGGSFAARFGRVAYLNGGGLDHPLAEIKMDGAASTATFAPRYNWRGLAEEPVCAAGQSCGTQYFGASAVSAYYEQVPTPNGPPAWSGSLIEGSRDASGLLYKRNRYYDPASGKFTSQDPLGLGGGLNVYGFAGGDPVNGDDPFGLCYHGEDKAAQANRTQSNVAACVDEPGLEDPGVLDPVAIGTGLLAGPLDAAISGALDRVATKAAAASAGKAVARVTANRAVGNAFRDQIAQLFAKNGYVVSTEVYKPTIFGARYIDIQVEKDGVVLGGIETKASNSARYSLSQQAKDAYLKYVNGYSVNVVRPPFQ
jgi:RHS repeat-associated protein